MMYKVEIYKGVELMLEQITVTGRVPVEASKFQGVVEGRSEEVLIAAMLNQADPNRCILLICLNATSQPVKLAAGAVVGEWYRVEEDIQEVEDWLQEYQKRYPLQLGVEEKKSIGRGPRWEEPSGRSEGEGSREGS